MPYFPIRACPELDSGMPFANTYKSVMRNYSGYNLTFFSTTLLPHILRGVARITHRQRGDTVETVVLTLCRFALDL